MEGKGKNVCKCQADVENTKEEAELKREEKWRRKLCANALSSTLVNSKQPYL